MPTHMMKHTLSKTFSDHATGKWEQHTTVLLKFILIYAVDIDWRPRCRQGRILTLYPVAWSPVCPAHAQTRSPQCCNAPWHHTRGTACRSWPISCVCARPCACPSWLLPRAAPASCFAGLLEAVHGRRGLDGSLLGAQKRDCPCAYITGVSTTVPTQACWVVSCTEYLRVCCRILFCWTARGCSWTGWFGRKPAWCPEAGMPLCIHHRCVNDCTHTGLLGCKLY